MKEKVLNWLREETEKIDKEISQIDIKMNKMVNKSGLNDFDKLAKLNQEKVILLAQENKLYEMIGRFSREIIFEEK